MVFQQNSFVPHGHKYLSLRYYPPVRKGLEDKKWIFISSNLFGSKQRVQAQGDQLFEINEQKIKYINKKMEQ